jgi:hypothetical protein
MAGYTYTTLVQAIKDFTDNTETVFVSQIDNLIKNAEERILKMIAPLQIFRKNATASMTLGTKYFPKPSDWLATYTLSILVSGEHKFLLSKDVNFIQEYSPDPTVTGEPKYYADFDIDNFIISPTPNAAYSSELHYFYRPTSIVDVVGGETWIGTNAGPALLYGSLVEAFSFIKGEPDMIQLYEQKFMQAAERLSMFAVQAEGLDTYRKSVA